MCLSHRRNFSNAGNWGFGISEHIDLGLKYDPNAGIYGMDFYVCMKRAGDRVASASFVRARWGSVSVSRRRRPSTGSRRSGLKISRRFSTKPHQWLRMLLRSYFSVAKMFVTSKSHT